MANPGFLRPPNVGWKCATSGFPAGGKGEIPDAKHFTVGMRPQNASRQQKVAELAEREYVVAHRELVDLGLSAEAIKRWARAGRLHRLYRGVYAVGHASVTGHGRWMAAVKACGREAVLSHQSAAALWGLRPSSSAVIDVTTPRRAAPHGIRVHRVGRLPPEDVARVDNIPVTSLPRTLLDNAEVQPLRQVVRLVEQAERLQLFDLGPVERLLARSPRRRGTPRLRAAIAAVNGEPPRVNSGWERDLLDWCEDHGIPRPELNVFVDGHEVDAFWRDKKLIVELDSYAFHRHLRAFENDRRRDAQLQLAEYLVLRLTRLGDDAVNLIREGLTRERKR
jgi:putative AbiEi antitoxin of type IV toxin-antitoxin system